MAVIISAPIRYAAFSVGECWWHGGSVTYLSLTLTLTHLRLSHKSHSALECRGHSNDNIPIPEMVVGQVRRN